jgi:hypothetical protein
MMKNYFVRARMVLAAILLALPLGVLSGQSGEPSAKGFTGEVTDTMCAPAGSHTSMMAKMPAMGSDAAACTRKCAQIGAKYVLMDEATKTVYQLDDQAKAAQFAGRKVHVTGTLVGSVIKVTDVNAIG